VWQVMKGTLERITSGDNLILAYLHIVLVGKQTDITYGYPVVELLRYSGDRVIELRPFNFDTKRIMQVFGPGSPG
jgi:hypothetical protein